MNSNVNSTLLVQMAESKWTACAMKVALDKARETNSDIVLVKFVPTRYTNWIIDDVANYEFSESECDELAQFEIMARKMGVNMRTQIVKYDAFEPALATTADMLNARLVLTQPTHDLHALASVLKTHDHKLCTVEQPAVTVGWTPELITVN